MSDHTIQITLRLLGHTAHHIGFGGGEVTLNPKYIRKFRHNLIWSAVSFQWYEPMWIVTNGIRLTRNENTQNALIELSENIPIILGISTDSYHPKNGRIRHDDLTDIFEGYHIDVVTHGPTSDKLVSMGRAYGSGAEVEIYSQSEMWYVNIYGDIFPSCDLSYEFMDQFKNTPVHLGNVHTNTLHEILQHAELLDKYIATTEDGILYVTEGYNGFEDEDLQKFNKLKKEENERIVKAA